MTTKRVRSNAALHRGASLDRHRRVDQTFLIYSADAERQETDMFRRLFAIETAAIQSSCLHADEPAFRQDQMVHPLGNSLSEVARFVATPSCYGMWSSRAAH